MGKQTKIEWTDHTWNPWQGCIKVSPGCKFCYMYRDKKRYGQDPMAVVRSKPPTFNKPLTWQEPARVFTCSWSDFFIEQSDNWRDEAWDIVRQTPHLTYQILTKRPENILSRLPTDWGNGWSNVWLGVSVENWQAEERIRHLLKIPARLRFLSCEPLLGPLNLRRFIERIDWVIIGGESGPKSRPFSTEWADDIIRQCKGLQVPVFVKQLGSNPWHNNWPMRVSDPKGGDPSEWPEWLRVREFPAGKEARKELQPTLF